MVTRCTGPDHSENNAEFLANRECCPRSGPSAKFSEAFLVRPRCRKLDTCEPGRYTVVCPGCFFREARSGEATPGHNRSCWTSGAEPDPPRERRQPRTEWEDGLHLEVDVAALGLLTEKLGLTRSRVDLTPCIPGPDPQLDYLVLAYLAELNCGNPSGRVFLDTLNLTLTARILAAYAAVPARLDMGSGGLPAYQRRRVVDFIETHLDENCPLERLAQEAGLGVYRFIRAFKASLGVTPHQFLLAKRIAKAKQLLNDTHDSITEIALAAGFSDSSQLSNVFRSRVGVSPRDYRQNLGNFSEIADKRARVNQRPNE